MSENNNILQRNGRAFLLRNGEMKDPYGMANFHPASNVNRLDLYLEDVAENSIILLNFRANRKGLYALQWFPTIFSGFETRKLSGEQGFRNFSRFWTLVPPQVTQWNANGKSPLSVETSVIQYSSDGLVGIFNSILELETTHNNYEELYNNNSVAYVYDDSEDELNPKMSFFMVDKDTIGEEDVYSWVAIDDPKTLLHYVQFKQYNVFNITIQKGNLPKPDKLMSITEQATHFVLHALQDMQSRIIGIDADIGNYSDGHKNTIKGYIGVLDNEIENVVKVDISNLENRVDEIVDTDLVNIVSDIEDLQQNKANESDLLLLDGRVEQIEDVELPKKADLTYVNNELDKKVDKTTYNAKIGLIDNELNRLDDVKAEKSQVYTKAETYTKNEIINKIANDLLNYYTKSEVYTKGEVDFKISQIPKFKIITVANEDALPISNIDIMAIYLSLESGKEYVWLENENRWEMLGTLDVDLTDYYDKDDVDTILLDYAKTIDVPTDISDLDDINNKWDTKVDKIAGKGLSTNDFTNNDKNKLDGIEAGAEKNTVLSVAGKTGIVHIGISDIDGLQGILNSKLDVTTFENSILNYYTKSEVDQIEIDTINYINTGINQLETSKQDKLIAGDNITIDATTNVISASGGGIDLNEMAYFDYAGSIYGDKYSLLVNAWESSLAVDPNEISENSSLSSPRGTAQYPNGETEGVIIPQGVTSIGSYAFTGWLANNQPLVIPNSVTSIGDRAFAYWELNNQSLVIPNSVTSIESSAFYNWTSNNQPLIIPNSVTSIEPEAFRAWSSNNQPLIIPNSITSIGYGAFRNWGLVPYVEIQAITPPTLTISNAFDGQNNAPIYVPNGSVEAYKTATNWVNLADRIFPISDKDNIYTKGEIDLMIGDIDTILDSILGV